MAVVWLRRGNGQRNGSAAAGSRVGRQRLGAASGDGGHSGRLPGGLHGNSSRLPQREIHPHVHPAEVTRLRTHFGTFSFNSFNFNLIELDVNFSKLILTEFFNEFN